MPDQPVGCHRPFRPWQERADILFDLYWIGLLGPAETPREPGEMCVNGEARLAEGGAEHDVRGLPADAGQRHKLLQAGGHPSTRAVPHRLAQPAAAVLFRPAITAHSKD